MPLREQPFNIGWENWGGVEIYLDQGGGIYFRP